MDKLRLYRVRWESILRQKSRETWLKEGDGNTKFFHASLLARRRLNQVHAIKKDHEWLFEPDQISKYFIKNFQQLFKSENPCINDPLRDLEVNCITQEDNLDLMRMPSVEEIIDAVWNLHPLKSPGPDGFSGIFY